MSVLWRLGVVVILVFILFIAQAVYVPYMQHGHWHWGGYDHGLDQMADSTALPDTPYDLGNYYFNVGNAATGVYDLAKARQYYEQTVHENPKLYDDAWYQLGRIDFLEGHYASAIAKFKKQLEFHQDKVPNVYYMIGLTYGYWARDTGNQVYWEYAAEGFQKYLEHDPASPWAHTDLAWIYFETSQLPLMKRTVERGLAINPDHPWLLNMYGLYLLNTQQPRAALEYLDRAKQAALQLTTNDWGRAYPGNNPLFWPDGLTEFQSVVSYNYELAEAAVLAGG